MCQKDVLDLLKDSDEWFDIHKVSKSLNINRSSACNNVKRLYRSRDVFDLEFIHGKRNQFLFRRRK